MNDAFQSFLHVSQNIPRDSPMEAEMKRGSWIGKQNDRHDIANTGNQLH